MHSINTFLLKYSFVSFFFFIVLQFSFAQSKIVGNRDVKIEQTNISDFHTLSIGNELDVVLVKSMIPSVTVEADSNLHAAIQFQVNDSILNFQINKTVKRAKEFKVIVRYTEPLKFISLSGNVDVITENDLQISELNLLLKDNAKINASIVTDTFNLENNIDSTFKLSTNCVLKVQSKIVNLSLNERSNNSIDINTESLQITTRNYAKLDIEGFSYNLEANFSEKSSVDASKLLTNVAKLKLSEKAQASIQASDTININASGSSVLDLYGEPVITIDKFSDTAEIHKKEI